MRDEVFFWLGALVCCVLVAGAYYLGVWFAVWAAP